MDYASHMYVATNDPILENLIEAFKDDLEGKILKIEIKGAEDEMDIIMGKLISAIELYIDEHYKKENIIKVKFSKPVLVNVLDQVFNHYIPVEIVQN